MANKKDNITDLQDQFNKKAKKMEDRNKAVIGGRFNEIMNMIDVSGEEDGTNSIAWCNIKPLTHNQS